MEIHELNTFSGTPGAADYLATDNGTDTSKISITDITDPLNTRIDNIIAGPASSAQEVIDARLGAEVLGSETYTSLGAAIRGQVTDLSDDLSDLKSELNDVKNANLINLISQTPFVKGSIQGGDEITSATRIRSGFIDVSNCSAIECTPANGYKFLVFCYDENKSYVSTSKGDYYYWIGITWMTGTKTLLMNPTVKYIRVLIADTSDSTSITPSDANKLSMLSEYPIYSKQVSEDEASEYFYNWLVNNDAPIKHMAWDNSVVRQQTNKIDKSDTRISSGIIRVPFTNGQIKLTTESGYKCAYYFFDESFANIRQYYWATDTEVDIPSNAVYVIICVSTSNNDNITPDKGNKVSIIFKSNDTNQKVLNITENPDIDLEWELGTLNPNVGTESPSTNRIRSRYILVGKGTSLVLGSNAYNHLVYTFDLERNYKSDTAWGSDQININEDCYIRILIRKSDNSVINTSEIANIASTEIINRAFPQVIIDADSILANDYPSYYDANIANAINSATNNIFDVGIDGDNFVFVSDIHWQSNTKHSPALIKEVIEKVNVGKTICGGDLIGGGQKADMIELMSDCINSFKDLSRFYVLLGNHDTNKIGADSSDDYFSKGEAYSLIQKESDFIMNYGKPCYFYFDNPTTKTRYICLDTGEEGTTLDSAQSNWLSNTLASMPTGYHALIFAHIIYQPTGTFHIGLQPSELARTSFMNDVCNILDTFNANHSDKKVEAIFGGHVHIDCDFVTNGGIPIVLTDCDARQTFTETSAGSGVANHAVGTINEQCFDITTIDYANKTIKCVRVGRGSNRTITY